MAELLNSKQQNQEENPTKIISECFVKPKREVEAVKKPYYLTALEIVGLNIDPIQKGLLFSFQNSSTCNRFETISHLLENLKHSLAIALVHFYPLAGRLITQKYPDEQASLIFLDCTKGSGARLIHARALDFSLSDILSPLDVPPIVRSFFDLSEKSVNYDGQTRALLSIQVTELQDGMFIGVTINHSICDGTSFIHFVNMLSEIYKSYELIKGDDINTIPNISRVPIMNYYEAWWIDNVCGNAIVKLPHLEPEKFIEPDYDPGLLRERVFCFSAKSMATLKAKANQECGTHNVISSFQSLIGLVWRSITRARDLKSDELTSCAVVVNARSRFDPLITDNYFGNYLSQAKGVCNVEELLGHDLGWASMILHKAIKAQDANAIRCLYKELCDPPFIISRGMVEELHGSNNVTVGGSARFDMYGPEFGLGRALAVRTGYANKSDAKVSLCQGREGGSVDVEICLRPHVMSALEIDLEFTSFVSLE